MAGGAGIADAAELLELALESSTERWDKAAGSLLVEEAGGIVTELPNPTGTSPGVVAAGPGIHAALAALVRR